MRGINKYLMVGLALLFAVGSIVIGMSYSSRRIPQAESKETAKSKPQSKNTTKENKQQKVKESEVLFLDDSYVFLTEDITDAYVEVVASKINKDDKEDVALFEEGKGKWEIQRSLNELFTQPVLIGSRVVEDVPYKETTTSEKIQEVATALKNSGIKDEFATTINTILGQEKATEESKAPTPGDSALVLPNPDDTEEIRNAKEQLTLVVQKGEVVQNFTMDGYLVAKEAIMQVPDGEVKTALLGQLTVVETAMTNMGIVYE